MFFRSLLLLCALLAASCVSSGPPTKPNEREWRALTAEYDSIRQIRASAPRAIGKPSRREQIEVQLETHKKLEPLLVPFLQNVKEYYERTGDPRAAAIYADERVVMGDEYFDILARYDRAVMMYKGALAIDPNHARARERLAQAEARRFVSMDLFASVKQGMSEDQVRRLLGQPREDWIKQVVQKKRVYSVWIYPKNDGGASAVYFDGGVVYHTNWNAAPAKQQAR